MPAPAAAGDPRSRGHNRRLGMNRRDLRQSMTPAADRYGLDRLVKRAGSPYL
jgi:hypothetical protein